MNHCVASFFVVVVGAGSIVAGAEPPAQQVADPSRESSAGTVGPAEAIAPPTRIPTENAIAKFEKRVANNPADHLSRIVLGRLYLRHARESDALPFYGKAEQVLREAVELHPSSLSAKTYLATALQSRHRFAEALQLAGEVLEAKPNNSLALATVGDSQLELGLYDEARATYEKLAAESQSPPVLARLAHLAELTGDRETAIDRMRTALAHAADSDRGPAYLAWYEMRMASLFAAGGRFSEAERHYRKALELVPDYAPAMSGLAGVLAARQDWDAGKQLYERAIKLHGEPPTMAALGEVHEALGERAEADYWYDRAEAVMAEEAETAAAAHYREVCLFFLDHDRHPARALTLAREDMKLRQDLYAHDTLAWALYKNGMFEEARQEIEHALRQGTQDAKLHYHAGMIYRALGDHARSLAELKLAIEINPQFSILGAERARQLIAAG